MFDWVVGYGGGGLGLVVSIVSLCYFMADMFVCLLGGWFCEHYGGVILGIMMACIGLLGPSR